MRVVLAVLVAAAAFGGVAGAAPAPDAYVLWRLDAGTGAKTQVASVAVPESGRLLARSVHDELAFATAGGLVIEGADGSNPVAVPTVTPWSAAFSPDGTQLAFTTPDCPGGDPNCTQVYVVAATGGAPRLLATHAGTAAWSPDGRMLAYIGDLADDEHGRLELEPADGGAVTDLAPSVASPLAFSPNGRRLAYACGNGVCIRDLGTRHVVDLRRLTKQLVTPSSYTLWSPNGRYLAVNTALNFDLGLVVVDLQRGTTRVLSGVQWLSEFAAPLAWSPDSTTLLWGYRYVRTRIFETNVRTGRRLRVSHDDRLWYFARWDHGGISFLTFTGKFQPTY